MKKRLLPFFSFLLLPLFFLSIRAKGQTGELSFQNYTTANGLCNNYVQNILEDSRGFIWIATREGLSRFDGAHFRNFFAGTDTATSFPHNNISNLVEYKAGHLLFTSSGLLWCMNTLTNSFYQAPVFLRNRHIPDIERMPDSSLLFCTTDTMFLCNRDMTLIRKIPSLMRGDGSICHILTGDTLLISNLRAHMRYVLSTGAVIPFGVDVEFRERENITTPLAYDKKNRSIYFANYWNGLYEYNTSGTRLNYYHANKDSGRSMSSNGTRSVLRLNDSLVLIGTDNGLNILNEHTETIYPYYRDRINSNSIAGNIIIYLFTDRAGNAWIGTTEGLSKLADASGKIVTIKFPVTNAPVSEASYIIEGNDPYLYSGLYGVGTIRINKTDNTITRMDPSIVTGPWNGFYHNNMLYIAGSGQKMLASCNVTTGQVSTPSFLEKYYGNGDIITMAYRDSHGDEWFSINQGGGLIRHPANSTIYEQYSRTATPGLFRHGYLANVTEDQSGNVWFSVNKTDILLQWNHTTKKFKEVRLDTVTGVRETVFGGVFYIYADKKETLWISYEGTGLIAYNIRENKMRLFTIRDGLPTHYIYSIINDHKGRLWLGTARGLTCYLPEESRFVTFKRENGLPSDEFMSSAIYFDDDTKTLWTSAGSTLLRIQPDDLLSQMSKNINVYLDMIIVNGDPVDPVQVSSFRHNQNNIQFQFTAVDIDNGKDLEFAYQLEGADPGWISSGEERSAIYSSLNPGRYVFRVKAKLKGDTEWTMVKQPFSFTVATPWWRTWWFRSLLLAAFAVVVIMIARNYYKRRLEKQKAILEKQQAIEKERTRIATDMHDDFGASLSRIKFLSEKLQLQKKDEPKINADLGKISSYSDEMAEKMGEIVWALNQRYDSSGDLASFCRSYASEYLEDKNIRLNFVTEQQEDIRINGEIRRNVFLVMKEALHNIVKHAHATEVDISMRCGSELGMTIRDNGRGFDEKDVRPFANGLDNMKKRMEEIGGKLWWRVENGTTVTLSVNPGIRQNTYR